MTIWGWLQPVEKLWKVVSLPEKGMITVHNEKNELIMEKKGLSTESVRLIEKNFLEIVAVRLTERKTGNVEELNKSISEYNYMYV